jgi:ribonuclease P protein component
LGVVAGKRVGNAAERNRAKRRLREVADRVDLAPNTAYVVVASPEVLYAPFGELKNWMENAIVVGGRARKKDKG